MSRTDLTATPPPTARPPAGRPGLDLFLVSAVLLFLELACIRWFPAHVLFLTFFSNAVLLACFVGMSIGCLLADRPTRHLDTTPRWLALALAAGIAVALLRPWLERYVDVASQANPDVVFYGGETNALRRVEFAVPVELVFAAFFVLIARLMVGPGQEMGRAFGRVRSRSRAYALNLLGSLAGILAFAACSYLALPPVVWFAAAAAGLWYFLRRPECSPLAPRAVLALWHRRLACAEVGTGETPVPQGKRQEVEAPLADHPAAPRGAVAYLAFAVLLTVGTSGVIPRQGGTTTTWSPYYRIDYDPGTEQITTNLIGHQIIQPRTAPSIEPYPLPYLFQRDVTGPDGSPAWPAFRRVLIIGAGSGNDVARAAQWLPPDARIDAVEIDPVIQKLGADRHPDRPYSDPRVTVHLDDGRNFLRRAADGTYDLVVFALIDSLALQTGYSSLRLESYLYTAEAFRDVRRVLKPTGVAVVCNFFRQGWIVARLRESARSAFGADPVVLTTPPRDEIRREQFDSGFTMLFAGGEGVVGPLRAAFARSGNSYWYPWAAAVPPDSPCRFSAEAPPPLPAATVTDANGRPVEPVWLRLRAAAVEDSGGSLSPATDDWPFLYARERAVPGITLRGIGLMLLLSAAVWWVMKRGAVAGQPLPQPPPRSGEGALPAPPSLLGKGVGGLGSDDLVLLARSFLLGAGFMLIETKAVVHMALLFGGTWTVNTVVFAAVLLMSLAGNLFAGWRKPTNLVPYYAGLFAALAANVAVPLDALLGLDRPTQVSLACLLTFLPIAFAGVIFAATFARAGNPGRLFGANVAGALAGGLAENLSLLIGFRLLAVVAAGFYLLSALAASRRGTAGSDGPPPAESVPRGRAGAAAAEIPSILRP